MQLLLLMRTGAVTWALLSNGEALSDPAFWHYVNTRSASGTTSQQLDFSSPKATCKTLCAAIESEGVPELEQCLANNDLSLLVLRRAIARHLIAQYHLSKLCVAEFGRSPEQGLPFIQYTTKAVGSWPRLIETANVRTTSRLADLTIASKPPMTFHLFRERGAWKLAIPSLDDRDIQLLGEDAVVRRVTWAALEQQSSVFWETTRLIQHRRLTDYSAVQRQLTHELPYLDSGEMSLPPVRYLQR
jgi:hypothetical protein